MIWGPESLFRALLVSEAIVAVYLFLSMKKTGDALLPTSQP